MIVKLGVIGVVADLFLKLVDEDVTLFDLADVPAAASVDSDGCFAQEVVVIAEVSCLWLCCKDLPMDA